MNTKLLMSSSAVLLGATGMVLTFMPGEISQFLKLNGSTAIVLQISGALYFGFAMLNWTAKGNLIGGIYSRPVAIGNFTHFMIGGLALIKLAMKNPGLTYVWIAAILYVIFALLFGWIFFTNPVSAGKTV
jgi:hypothetical protein